MTKLAVTTGMTLALAFANLASANVFVLDNATVTHLTTGDLSGMYEYTYTAKLDGVQEFHQGTVSGHALVNAYCLSAIQGLDSGTIGTTNANAFLSIDSNVTDVPKVTSLSGFNIYQGTSGGCGAAPTPLASGVFSDQIGGAWIEVVYTGTADITPSTYLPSINFYSLYSISATDNMGFGGDAYSVQNFNQQVNQGQLSGPSSSAPEPATLTLFGSALLGIGFFARKRIKKS
jgi:hypothetical protein